MLAVFRNSIKTLVQTTCSRSVVFAGYGGDTQANQKGTAVLLSMLGKEQDACDTGASAESISVLHRKVRLSR